MIPWAHYVVPPFRIPRQTCLSPLLLTPQAHHLLSTYARVHLPSYVSVPTTAREFKHPDVRDQRDPFGLTILMAKLSAVACLPTGLSDPPFDRPGAGCRGKGPNAPRGSTKTGWSTDATGAFSSLTRLRIDKNHRYVRSRSIAVG